MKEKKYSEIFPLLPEDFDEMEEYISFGVVHFYEKVIDLFNSIKKNIDLKEFDYKLEKILKNNADFPNAMQRFMEIGKIEGLLKDVRLYVMKKFENSKIIIEFLEKMPNEYKEKLIDYAMKTFFDYYYRIYRACPECGDVEENMIYNPINKRWYCKDCFSNRDPSKDSDYYYNIWDD